MPDMPAEPESELSAVRPDRFFDGGDLDCGSGLVLLIREQMLEVPENGILEMRSREPSVRDDLPPWCRLSGHEYIGALDSPEGVRYFVRKGKGAAAEEVRLREDKERAKAYEWRLRVRASGRLTSTVYCRNFSFEVGQPASFEEKDRHPSALEYTLGALGADLATGFASACARENLVVDDVEVTVRGRLHNVLAHLGLEEGDPSLRGVEIKCFASTMEDEAEIRRLWEQTVSRSPLTATLRKAAELEVKIAIV